MGTHQYTRTVIRVGSVAARVAAGAMVIRRIAGVANASGPVQPATRAAQHPDVTVVVPARDEADRIGPLLDAIVGAPGLTEVIVVDDESTDTTADLARVAGARVIHGESKPDGWAGKAWALQQGIEAATTEWVVTLDADTRPSPELPSALVARMLDDRLDLLTVGGRFECPTGPARWLHASMLTTLVYRFGAPGTDTPPERTMANGQCMAFRRQQFLDAGGMTTVAAEVVEDLALARHLAASGWKVAFLDAAGLLTVRMFESLADTWTGWGRSLALPGVSNRDEQLRDLAVLALAQALPIPRLLLAKGDVIDIALAAIRIGTLAGTRTSYDRADTAYWLSPLADLASVTAIATGIARKGRQTWRGRTYS